MFDDVKDILLRKEKLDNDLGSSNRSDDQASYLIVRDRSWSKGPCKA